MEPTETEKRTVILGIGNLLMKDEGVGVHAAVNLQRFPLPEGIEVIEGGTDGFKLFHLIQNTDRLIVVDCVKGGGEPASIYRFDIDDINQVPDMFKTSVHQISILDVVNLSELVNKRPRTTVIGIEPEEFTMSMDLSQSIVDKMPIIMHHALDAAGLDPEEYQEYIDAPLVQPGPDNPVPHNPL
jgi:hydrogenase maturation protease